MSSAPRKPRPLRWLWRGLYGLAGLVVLLAIGLGVAVVMLRGDYGTVLARELANGREIAGYGVLRVGVIRGNILERFEIETLSVADETGVWLEASDIAVSWSPAALVSRQISLESVRVGEARILRPPQRASDRPDSSGGSFDWEVRLAEAALARLVLDEGVAGPQAVLRAEASLNYAAGAISGSLDAERLDAPGDGVTARFEVAQTIAIALQFSAAPDGPITALLGVPGTSLSGEASVTGSLIEGSGEGQARLDGAELLTLEAEWDRAALDVRATARPQVWPSVQSLVEGWDAPVTAQARFDLGEVGLSGLSLDGLRLDLRSRDLAAEITPVAEGWLEISAELGRDSLTFLSRGAVDLERATLSGLLQPSPDFSFDGEITASGLSLGDEVGLDTIGGSLTLSRRETWIDLRAGLDLDGVKTGLAQVQTALGETQRLEAEASFDTQTGQLAVTSVLARIAVGEIAGSASLDTRALSWRARLESAGITTGAFTELVSAAQGVSITAEGALGGEQSAQFAIDQIVPSGQAAQYLSAPLAARGDVRRSPQGLVQVSALRLTSPELELAGQGSLNDGVVRLGGDLVWAGGVPVSMLSLDGVANASFDVSASQGALDTRLDLRTSALSFGGQRLSEPRLRLETSGLSDEMSGAVRLTAGFERGPIDISARFERSSQGVAIPELSGQGAGFFIEAEARLFDGDMAVTSTLTPELGVGQIDLEGRLRGTDITLALNGRDLSFGDLVYLDAGQLDLSGTLEAMAVRYSAQGAYGSRFNLGGQGELALGEAGPLASLALSGRYGGITLETLQPMAIHLSPEPRLDALFKLDEGEAFIEAAFGPEARIEARLDRIPAAVLSLRRAREPVLGEINATASFQRLAEIWTGELEVRGANLRPAESPDERALDGLVRATLDAERLSGRVEATGNDLSANAEVFIETGPLSSPADLLWADWPLTGSLFAQGRIGDFAAFHLNEAQILEGVIDADARFGGTVSDINLDGAARLGEARFRDGRAGIDMRQLIAEIEFTPSGGRLTRLSASDGDGGRLTGTGAVDLGEALSVSANVEFDRFQWVNRRDVTARASGNIAFVLEGDQGSVSGEAVIDRADIQPPDGLQAPIARIDVTEINRPAGLDPAPARQSGPRLALDYRVRAPRRVYVRGPNFDTEWGFDMSVRGFSNDPQLSGEAELVRGRADLLGRDFELQFGEIILDGDPMQASLNVLAVNAQSDFTARVRASGTVSEPQISLSSEPVLPQDEIVSRILFGESASTLSPLQAAQLAGAVASLSGSGGGFDPLGQLRDVAGLDMLGVRRNASGDTVVAGGRYLSEDVFLTVEGAARGEGTQTRIDWSLTPRFTLSSSLNAQGRAGLALSWRVEYDDNPFAQIELFRGFRDHDEADGTAGPSVREAPKPNPSPD